MLSKSRDLIPLNYIQRYNCDRDSFCCPVEFSCEQSPAKMGNDALPIPCRQRSNDGSVSTPKKTKYFTLFRLQNKVWIVTFQKFHNNRVKLRHFADCFGLFRRRATSPSHESDLRRNIRRPQFLGSQTTVLEMFGCELNIEMLECLRSRRFLMHLSACHFLFVF